MSDEKLAPGTLETSTNGSINRKPIVGRSAEGTTRDGLVVKVSTTNTPTTIVWLKDAEGRIYYVSASDSERKVDIGPVLPDYQDKKDLVGSGKKVVIQASDEVPYDKLLKGVVLAAMDEKSAGGKDITPEEFDAIAAEANKLLQVAGVTPAKSKGKSVS